MRRVICKAIAALEAKEGNYISPAQVAEERYGKTHPMLVAVMKAAVPGGGTGSGEWGSELVTADNRYTGDFVEYLYGETVFDKLPLREVPHNVVDQEPGRCEHRLLGRRIEGDSQHQRELCQHAIPRRSRWPPSAR